MKSPTISICLSFMALLIAPVAYAAGTPVAAGTRENQLPNLSEEKPKPRITVKGITWPAAAGDAEICLWKDDKIAPLSFTVDDNNAPDVPWWLEQADKHGFKITWFIITKNVNGVGGFGGDWALWNGVLAKGHDVQSHSHTHLHGFDAPGWIGIDKEYSESKKLIEANMPGHRARFLAYPGGAKPDPNDRTVAAKYYAGVRGVTGVLVNPGVIDYLSTRAIVDTSLGNPKAVWADFKRALDPTDKVYRSWGIYIYHTVKDKTADRPLFHFIDANKDVLWLSIYGDTSLYAQERDTATLVTKEKTDSRIVLALSDRMDDTVFDYPLTLKVRLPDNWKTVAALQGGKPVSSRVIEHEGARYALVDVVPDKGDAVLGNLIKN